MLEYRNGKLVVDELVFDPSCSTTHFLVKIEDQYFKVRNRQSSDQIKAEEIVPYKKAVDEKWTRGTQWQYFMQGVMPRGGYLVNIGRAITETEFNDICTEFELTEDDISEEFEEYAGAIYGDDYKKQYTAKQIRVPGGAAIALEQRLVQEGIQAANGSPGRVNIRVAGKALGE